MSNQTPIVDDLYQQRFPAVGTAKGAVLFTHGIAEHSGRHLPLIQALTAGGYDIYTYDLRGHGKSPGTRAKADVYDLVKEHLLQRNQIQSSLDGLPFFLFGHSLGGLITARSVQRDPRGLSGVILSAPGLRVTKKPLGKLSRWALGTLSKLGPGMRLVPLDTEHLTHDAERAADGEADPLNFRKRIPILTAYTTYLQGAMVQRKIGDWPVDTLLFHGTSDTLVQISGSEFFAENAGKDRPVPPVIDFFRVEGAYHEVFNETMRADLQARTLAWLDAHLPA